MLLEYVTVSAAQNLMIYLSQRELVPANLSTMNENDSIYKFMYKSIIFKYDVNE